MCDKEEYMMRRSVQRSYAYPRFLIRQTYRTMKRVVNLDSQEFQDILKQVCKERGMNVTYVNKHAHIVASGHSTLSIVQQRAIANCMKLAMAKIDENEN